MPGARRPDLKAAAIKLRVEQRLGRNEIARRLEYQVNPVTVGRWLRPYPLATTEVKRVNKVKRSRSRKPRVKCVRCGAECSRSAKQYCGDCILIARRIPTADYLVENRAVNSTRLKARLLKEGRLEEICIECGQGPVWNKKPLVLQLDHISGVKTDNRIENLRILCANCHTQTPTYVARNKSNPDRVSGYYVKKLRKASG